METYLPVFDESTVQFKGDMMRHLKARLFNKEGNIQGPEVNVQDPNFDSKLDDPS